MSRDALVERVCAIRDGRPRPCHVYRLYDHRNRGLYVGIAYDVDARLRQHAAEKTWWRMVRLPAAVTPYRTRDEALAAEAELIASRRFAFNIAGAADGGDRARQAYQLSAVIEEVVSGRLAGSEIAPAVSAALEIDDRRDPKSAERADVVVDALLALLPWWLR